MDFYEMANQKPQEGREKGSYTIPYWSALDYLERISKVCAKSENRRYAEELMRIVRDVTRPKDGDRADNYRTWWCFTKIMSNLPTEVITLEDMDLVGDWLDSHFGTTLVDDELGRTLLPKLLQSPLENDWTKAAKLVAIVTRIHWVDRKYGEDVKIEPETVIEKYWLEELLKSNAPLLGQKCGSEVIAILKGRLGELLNPEKDNVEKAQKNDAYSYIWRPAIEDHKQNVGADATNILTSALRDVLLAFSKKRSIEAKETLQGLLGAGLFTIKRIALYVVNELYHIHGQIFWKTIRPEPFLNINLQHELFELLKTHFSNFSPEQQDGVINIIDALTKDWRDETQKPTLDAQLRLGWLLAIQGQDNKRADNLYQKYLKIAKPAEHPEFASYRESSWGDVSPYTTEALLSMSVPEIVRVINNFKESSGWKEPTKEGFADVLKDAVKQEPEKFQDDLTLFIGTKPSYQNAVLRSFVELWEHKKPINWEAALKFCLMIVESEAFWQQGDGLQKRGAKATRSWVTSTISRLIDAGVRSDDWAFEETYLSIAEKIILQILEKEPPTARGQDGDALTEAINTPKGHCLEALINYSLRQAGLADKKKNDHSDFWRHIQPTFEGELDRCTNDNFEFSALAGRYLPQLHYLSKDWVEASINRIFSVDYTANWRCAMEGYSHVNPYKEIYRLLRKHGHLVEGLETDFKNPQVRKILIEHISVAYLWGLEVLSDEEGLFTTILREWRQEDISKIIFFFWTHRHAVKVEDKASARVLDFWKWCYEKIQGHEEENAGILSDLNLLAVFLKEISDGQKSWLLQSAPYVEENYHSLYFLEYLDTLADKNPKAVADVYIEMLTRTVPTGTEKEVRSIVEKLYQTGLGDKANHISNEYARKGHPDLLRDLYDRYNS